MILVAGCHDFFVGLRRVREKKGLIGCVVKVSLEAGIVLFAVGRIFSESVILDFGNKGAD